MDAIDMMWGDIISHQGGVPMKIRLETTGKAMENLEAILWFNKRGIRLTILDAGTWFFQHEGEGKTVTIAATCPRPHIRHTGEPVTLSVTMGARG